MSSTRCKRISSGLLALVLALLLRTPALAASAGEMDDPVTVRQWAAMLCGASLDTPVESGCGLKSPEPAGSSARIRSFTTSPARISPTTEGTKALLPGTCRRWVHFRAVPGGQMQCVRQLMDILSKGVIGGSLE